jgi:hypothetical protein
MSWYGKHVVEDEYHLLMECPFYDAARLLLFQKLWSTYAQRSCIRDLCAHGSAYDLFVTIMNSHSYACVRALYIYLKHALRIRMCLHEFDMQISEELIDEVRAGQVRTGVSVATLVECANLRPPVYSVQAAHVWFRTVCVRGDFSLLSSSVADTIRHHPALLDAASDSEPSVQSEVDTEPGLSD